MTIYISHLFEDKDLSKILLNQQHKLNDCEFGIETIDFAAGNYLDEKEVQMERYQERIGHLLSNHSLSIHGPFLDLCPHSFDRYIREATRLRYEETYQIAKKLRAKHLIFHSCLIPSIYYTQIWKENSLPFWREFMSDKDDSIAIHLENVFDEDYHPMKNLIQQVDHPQFSMCLDIGHAHCFSSQPLEEWFVEMSGDIGHLHLHNNDGKKDLHWQLDQGSIDMDNTLTLIEKYCPQVDWTLEMNSGREVESSLDYLKGKMTK